MEAEAPLVYSLAYAGAHRAGRAGPPGERRGIVSRGLVAPLRLLRAARKPRSAHLGGAEAAVNVMAPRQEAKWRGGRGGVRGVAWSGRVEGRRARRKKGLYTVIEETLYTVIEGIFHGISLKKSMGSGVVGLFGNDTTEIRLRVVDFLAVSSPKTPLRGVVGSLATMLPKIRLRVVEFL